MTTAQKFWLFNSGSAGANAVQALLVGHYGILSFFLVILFASLLLAGVFHND